jgi:hypothetical protein
MRLSQIMRLARETIDEVRYLHYLDPDTDKAYLLFHAPSSFTLQFLQKARATYDTMEQAYILPVEDKPEKLSSTSWKYPLPTPLKWVLVRTLPDDIQVEAWE